MAISVLDVKLLLQYLLVFQIGGLAHFQLCLQEHSFTLLKEEKKRYPNGQQHSVHWNIYFFPIFCNVLLHSYVHEVNVNREKDCMGRTRSSNKRPHQLDDSRPHQLDTVTQRSLITTVHLCSSECLAQNLTELTCGILTSRLVLGTLATRIRPCWIIRCPWICTLGTDARGASSSGGGPVLECCRMLWICWEDTEMGWCNGAMNNGED